MKATRNIRKEIQENRKEASTESNRIYYLK